MKSTCPTDEIFLGDGVRTRTTEKNEEIFTQNLTLLLAKFLLYRLEKLMLKCRLSCPSRYL